MKRALLAVAFVAGVVPATAMGGPTHDFATGGGWAGDFAQVEFSAQRTDADHVIGQGSFKTPGSDRVYFDVECLEVDGNRATLGGPPREDFFGASYILFDVEDNGPASLGADTIIPRFSGTPATDNCTSFAFSDPLIPLTQGNITVEDGTP